MGINGLLLLLKPCCKDKKLYQYRGQRAAVDTYAWLHKIIKGPSGLALIKGGRDKFKFVRDILKRIDKIQSQGVKLVLVFDGGPLPRKREQQEVRKKRRQQNYQKARDLLDAGDQQGYKKMTQSIDISPDMAYHLILQLKKNNIQFIVAPYQADAQLAYLCRTGYVDFILTEDSDLLAFGAPKVLYKFDFINMTGQQICLDHIKKCSQLPFTWFTHSMFLTTCILSGCDYVTQLSGIGIKKALKIISRVTTFRRFIEELSTENIPSDYEQNFFKAFLTFRYQRVYCPIRKKCVEVNQRDLQIDIQSLKKIDQSNTQWSQQILNAEILEYVKLHEKQMNFDFLGPYINPQIAKKIAQGIINPVTLQKYEIDDLDSLKYNGPVSLSQTMMIRPKNKKEKDRSQFFQQSAQMAQFLNKNKQKKNFQNKPNYRPLNIAQDQTIQYYSLDENSESQSNLMINLNQNEAKEMKNSKQSKGRKLMFKNQSDSSQDEQKEGNASDSSSMQKNSAENGLNLDEYIFEKSTQNKKNVQISALDMQFNFTKLKQKKNQFLMEQDSYQFQKIVEVNEIQEMSAQKQKNSVQYISSFQQQIGNQHKVVQNQINDKQQNQLTFISQTEQYERGEKSQDTEDRIEQRNIFFQLANSIKFQFGEEYFRDPLNLRCN